MKLTFNNDDLERVSKEVQKDPRYGFEGELISRILNEYPLNNDDEIIAMKIALIDMTNSTNLNKFLGKILLNRIIEKIKSIDFDRRVMNGDITLIEELSSWSKKEGINLFSFFSKYCLYHNYCLYKKDDFCIFDSILGDHLIDFISPEEYYKLTGKKLIKSFCYKLRDERNYFEYKKIIDYILEKNNITTEFKRRKFDSYVWYLNRGSNK